VQAVAAGDSDGQIRGLLKKEWTAPYRGVYVERVLWDATTREQQHVLMAAARILSSALSPVASRRTGAFVHALPILGRPPRAPQLARASRRPGDRSESAALQVVPLDPSERVVVGGVPVTSLVRTGCDVARTTSFWEAVVVADAVLRRRAAGVDHAGGLRGGDDQYGRARRAVRAPAYS
jgi:hypothetical protein